MGSTQTSAQGSPGPSWTRANVNIYLRHPCSHVAAEPLDWPQLIVGRFLWHVLTINMRITTNQSSCTVQTHRICALWRNMVKVIRLVLGEMEVFTINMIPVNNFQWKTCFSSMRDCFYSQLIESFITWCNSNPTRSTNELVLVYCCICECVNYWESQIPCMCSRVWLIKHQILKCGSFTHMFDPAAQTISTISTV